LLTKKIKIVVKFIELIKAIFSTRKNSDETSTGIPNYFH